MKSFADLALPASLLPGLDALKLELLTPVQAQSLPVAMQGGDVLAIAPTGSGKTVAFGLALLNQVDLGLSRVQGLVLCPTRELADQVGKQLRKLAVGMPNLKLSLLYGGVALGPQIASLEQHDPHVVVGTPGRIQELIRKKHLHLAAVRSLVLDEADRMLDMGFIDALHEIINKTPQKRQSLLFSATWPAELDAMLGRFMREPLRVEVEGAATAPAIEESFIEVVLNQKSQALWRLLAAERPESCVVFCNTRRDVGEVAAALGESGCSALALHGEMEQRDRDEVLLQFANRSCRVLVASDVAARGLDIDELAMVVNYELPTDAEAYQHRIGRTGRAGRSGLAVSLVTAKEMPRALALESNRGKLQWRRVPTVGGESNLVATMRSLRIDAGKTDKLRPGDVLGALTGDAGLPAKAIGKIDVFATRTYVAVERATAGLALKRLQQGKIKGRKFRVTAL